MGEFNIGSVQELGCTDTSTGVLWRPWPVVPLLNDFTEPACYMDRK